MDDVLQALAKMLNMTVDEVSSLLTTFKGNAPQVYEEEIKLERIERKRKELKLPIKVSCISSSASLITLVVAIVLKITLAPNYIFIVNEILPRLTKR